MGNMQAPGQGGEANMAAVNYYVGCIDGKAEVGLGFLRQELLNDAGIGSGKRFEDPDKESWRGDSEEPAAGKKSGKNSGKQDDTLESLTTPDMAEFDKQVGKSDFSLQASQVEKGARLRFGSIEIFLDFLNKRHGSEGAFEYGKFKLAEFKDLMPETMRTEIAVAFARLIIKASKEAREGLTRDVDKEAAAQIIAEEILNS